LGFEGWFLPAFGIPIRNPTAANHPGRLESGPNSRRSKETLSIPSEMI